MATKKPSPKKTPPSKAAARGAAAKKPAARRRATPAVTLKKATRAAKPARPFKASKASARAFVVAVRLPAAPKVARYRDIAPAQFADARAQAAVVGAGLVSFTAGVPAPRREDLCNATLLAQLAANRKVPDRAQVLAWFDAYVAALMNLGWVVQQTGFREYDGEFDGLETHEAVRQAAAALLVPNPAALAVLAATLDAVQAMERDSPWITLFERASRDTKTSQFQIALADQLPNGGLVMHLLAFAIQANAKITQVLFFKLKKKRVKLQQNTGQAIVDVGVLTSIRGALKTKLAERVTEFIATVDI
ncbi:MAG TPA: hypothetical protein PJ986_02775 [Gammaproteobacteria bacterium]|nr:hypothetical protein [Gammaproteobacteria bacterium]